MGRKELRDGYLRVMQEVYEPEGYFDRLEDLYLKGRLTSGRGMFRYWHRHPWVWLKRQTKNLVATVALFRLLMLRVPDAALRRVYRRRFWRLLGRRPDPDLTILFMIKCAMHYHKYSMARQMAAGDVPVYNSFY
jgi:hypothetical protein